MASATYSAFDLIRRTVSGAKWPRVWRNPEPKPSYDVIIVGGGGHGLATAFYLAKEHGIHNVAVVERGVIGQGNVGRNTTIVRSNYPLSESIGFYENSLKLWETLEQQLNYNVMMSQRGVLNLAHSPTQMDAYARRGNLMVLEGADAELMDRDTVRRYAPMLDFSENARFPIYGGLMQHRGGTARHDAVAWGFARAADQLGVDIIQQAEVVGFLKDGERIVGVETTRGEIRAPKVGVAVAGHTSQVMAKAGIEYLPIESHVLQAFVSEGLKPMIDTVVTFGAGHFYISQSDKGGLVFGGDLDGYNSYASRGGLRLVTSLMAEGVSMIPALSRLRILRQWGGVMDMSMDGSPIIDRGPLPGLYLNCGWCYGGFKAVPGSGWCFAHTIAQDRPHKYNEAYSLDRFRTGRMIDDKGAGPVPGWH